MIRCCLIPLFACGAALAQIADSPDDNVAGIPVNYTEAKVGSYTLPDVLKLADGQPVRDAATWLEKRRPEIVRLFEENQYGRSPGRPAEMSFDVFEKAMPALGGKAIRRQVTIYFSKDTDGPKMDLLIYLPAGAGNPVPLLLNLGFGANNTTVNDPNVKVGTMWDRKQNKRVPMTRGFGGMNVLPLIEKGFGFATFNYTDVDPDALGAVAYGVRKLYLKEGQTEPATDEWGSIAAWAWGISRAIDYFETDGNVDAQRIAIMGVSRLGKTVLWAGARDPRVAMVIASCSGEGGAALSRRNYGETIKHLVAPTRFPYQFCANYAKWADKVDEFPVDAHMLIALIAPRPVLLQTGYTDKWSDPYGEFLAAVAAGPVYELLGKQSLDTDKMPAPGEPILHTLGFYMHKGGHGSAPEDWPVFLKFMQISLEPAPHSQRQAIAANDPNGGPVDYATFKDPPREYWGHAWFTFVLPSLTEDRVKSMIQRAAQSDSYGGFMITPDGGFGRTPGGAAASDRPAVTYLNDEFFKLYKIAIEEGLKNNLPMDVLYDELQFPTGMAGGLFYAKHPDDVEKSLEKIEEDVMGPADAELTIPIANSIYLGSVLMNLDTLECVDVSSEARRDGLTVKCQIPAGNWKAMAFYLDPARRRGICDYLDPKAVDELIEVMYDQYYDHLKEYFGKVIKMSFYDEPSLHNAVSGRLWTAGFNEWFQQKHGYSPMKYYPALWYDIGPETAAARNALFGFRAELYAENFVGRIAAWCKKRGIAMSGHMDQEEPRNPVGTQGDLMKVFKHQHIPGIDDIWFTGRSNVSYKVIASAAYNYDRPLMMAETYAAYGQEYKTTKWVYRTAMDQHAMGANLQIGGRPGETANKDMGQYVGRMEYLLRHGRHVADVAVLYPIASLQADYSFAQPTMVEPVTGGGRGRGEPGFYYALEGGILAPENDYMGLGEMLFRGMRIDFTYLHPEILESKCLIEGNKLILDNVENREEFRVLIVPGGSTISVATAKKILDFYRAGGTVIATSKLPTRSAEFKRDKEVQQIVGEVFGIPAYGPMTATIRAFTDDFKTFFAHIDPAGGKAYFLPRPEPKMLDAVLKEALPVRDVDVRAPWLWPVPMNRDYAGALTYIHKVKGGRDIYFFANSTDAAIDATVVLRGNKTLTAWDPHTGDRREANATASEIAGQAVTSIHLVLQPLTSLFYVQD